VSPRGTTAGFRRVQTCAELRGLRNVRRCSTDAQASADGNSTHAARCLSLGLMANTFGKRGSRMLLAMSSTLVALGGLDFVEASRLHARQIAHTLVEINQSMAGTYLAASYASPANCHRALSIEPSARSDLRRIPRFRFTASPERERLIDRCRAFASLRAPARPASERKDVRPSPTSESRPGVSESVRLESATRPCTPHLPLHGTPCPVTDPCMHIDVPRVVMDFVVASK
jgi:hypothetical protein